MVFIIDVKAERVNGVIKLTIPTFNLLPPLFPYWLGAEFDGWGRRGSIRLAMPPGTADIIEQREIQPTRQVTVTAKVLGTTTDRKVVRI